MRPLLAAETLLGRNDDAPPWQRSAFPWAAPLPAGVAAVIPSLAGIGVDPGWLLDFVIDALVVFQQPASGATAGVASALVRIQDGAGNFAASAFTSANLPATASAIGYGQALTRQRSRTPLAAFTQYLLWGYYTGPVGCTATLGSNGSGGVRDSYFEAVPVHPR